MSMYQDIIAKLKLEADKMGGQAALMRFLDAKKAPFYRTMNSQNAPNSETLFAWLEKLGVKFVFPGDPAPGQSAGAEDLTDKVRELERQVDELKEYKAKYEAALEFASVMSGNKPQPQQLTLPEPEAKRKIA